MAQMAARACQWFGVAMLTMWTVGSSMTRRRSWTYLGSSPCFCLTVRIAWAITAVSTSQTWVTAQLFRPAKPLTWDMPRPLTPMTATLRRSPTLPGLGWAFSCSWAVIWWTPAPASAPSAAERRRKSRRLNEAIGGNPLGYTGGGKDRRWEQLLASHHCSGAYRPGSTRKSGFYKIG